MTGSDPHAPIRGHIRQVGFRRVAHGLFLPIKPDPEPDDEFRRDLRAWLMVLPQGARFTHVTAARLLGWQLPNLPEQVPVFAAVDQSETRPRRPGLICSRLVSDRPRTVVKELPIDPPEEILLRAARDLGLLDLLILVDSARRLGHVDEGAMTELMSGVRPGVRALRAAWALSSRRAESAGETILRLFDATLEVPVEPQAELSDEAGNFVAKVDLLVIGTAQVHEYDGAHHRGKRQHRIDLRRDRGLGRAGYERRGFTLDDLVNQPAVTMHEIDRDLGRAHDVGRLEAWRRILGNSLYAPAGRRRVMNRWQRQMGVTDWSRTA